MHGLTQQLTPDSVNLVFLDKQALTHFQQSADEFTRRLLTSQGFKGEYGETALISARDGSLKQVAVGAEAAPPDPRATIQRFAALADALPGENTYRVDASQGAAFDWEQAALGWGLAAYRFSRYVKPPTKVQPTLYLPENLDLAAVTRQLEAIFWIRDLINTPANDLGPAELCAQAETLAEKHGADSEITRGEALLDKGFPAVHAVGKGSVRPPALIDLRWGKPDHPKISLVGKGVIFDTGGLSLKTNANMLLMKKDMGGAAVALGLAKLVMDQALPVRLRVLIPAVENSPGQGAYRPSDIIPTRKGLTVEIGNTDAEGRVILCDALAEAVAEQPDLIIDLATLTGAARVALGPDVPAFWTPSDDLAGALEGASRQVADPIWRLPLWHPYLNLLQSPIADLNNMPSHGQGGAISAALFLHEFVKPYRNWVHFDLFGWNKENTPGAPKGGEAHTLRAINRFLKDRYSR